jgi:hypothetical protein
MGDVHGGSNAATTKTAVSSAATPARIRIDRKNKVNATRQGTRANFIFRESMRLNIKRAT